MNELLTVVLFALLPFGWLATGMLAVLSLRRPALRVLQERAALAALCSLVATLYFGIAVNTDVGFAWFPLETAIFLVRTLMVTIAAFPLVWLVLYLTGRLGVDE